MNIETAEAQDTAAFVTRLSVNPGDIIVAKLTRRMRPEDMIRLAKGLGSLFPGHHIGILEEGTELVIVSGNA